MQDGGAETGSDRHGSARPGHSQAGACGRREPPPASNAAPARRSDRRVPGRLSARAPGARCRSRVSRCRSGVWRERSPLRAGRRLPARPTQGPSPAASGRRPDAASRGRAEDTPLPRPLLERRHRLAGHSCHHRSPHTGRSRPASVTRPLLPRWKKCSSDVHVTLSTLERSFLVRLREAGLPLPQTNRPASGRRVDCRWPAQRLTVELDGYRYHRSRHAWELDRRREREARGRGDEFRRYSHGDVRMPR